jgi:hypothetical protein
MHLNISIKCRPFSVKHENQFRKTVILIIILVENSVWKCFFKQLVSEFFVGFFQEEINTDVTETSEMTEQNTANDVISGKYLLFYLLFSI